MAVDKLVDSTQLDADLTSVANAIRTKGGTSAQMAFPTGFVSAVNAIPTGGSGTKQITITENGTTTEDVSQYANAEITVNVEVGETVMDVKNPLGTKYSEIPDLSVLDRTGQVLYFVVDTSRCDNPIYEKVGLRPSTGGPYTFDRGHISNGQFVVDETETVAVGEYWQKTLDKTHGRFWIYRITSENNIERIDSYNPNEMIGNSTDFQTIVAAYGNLPYLTSASFLSQKENLLLIDVTNIKMIPTLSKVYVAKLDGLSSGMISNLCYTNRYIQKLDLSTWGIDSSTLLSGMFFDCQRIREIIIGTHNTSGVTTIANMFNSDYSLESLDLSGLDLSGVTNTNGTFNNCYNLNRIVGWTNISVSYDLSKCPLTHDSLLVVLNALPTVSTTQTLTLGTGNTGGLTSDEIAIATAKGWTVA